MRPVFLATIAVLWALPICSTQGMGPFNIELQTFEVCPNVKVENPVISNTKFSKVGRKKVAVSFDVNARYGINNNNTFKIDVAVKTQNGFKHNYFNMEGPVVTTLKNYMPEYYKQLKFPMPPGNYSVRNTIVEPQPTLIKTFFYGTFKIICTFHHKDELLGCVNFILQTMPKRKP